MIGRVKQRQEEGIVSEVIPRIFRCCLPSEKPNHSWGNKLKQNLQKSSAPNHRDCEDVGDRGQGQRTEDTSVMPMTCHPSQPLSPEDHGSMQGWVTEVDGDRQENI